MRNLWNEVEAIALAGPVGECVYGSRLLGSDPDLVLHGGGNTSVKAPFADITGTTIDALYVKGSGWDLATIETVGFTPLPLDRLQRLLELEYLADADMMRELSAARLDPAAPQPSVETLLHAFLPFPAIQHSHADVIVTLTNLADAEMRVRQVFGDRVVVVPYVMPGFGLAQAVRDIWPAERRPETIGMLLLNHGLFTFGDTTYQAYAHHVDLITLAEAWLDEHAPPRLVKVAPLPDVHPVELADLRLAVSRAAGRPMVGTRNTGASVARFVRRSDLSSLADRGPLTPDHVIRTKRTALVGRDVDGYVAGYTDYYQRNEDRGRVALSMLDPAPRVVLDPDLGMVTFDATAQGAAIAADVYCHTIPVLERCEDSLGGYLALAEGDLFDCEYWDLEQAKLRRSGPPPPMTGMVALVTGAASGIGRACAVELGSRGAAVVGIDLADSVATVLGGPGFLGVVCDVTDSAAQAAAVVAAVERFGGIDIVVSAAGIFGSSATLGNLDLSQWRKVMAVNVDAVADLFAKVEPFLARSPVGGRVAVIASKNVPAPGKGAAAYSASKAALTQLCRVAALEWAEFGTRVNMVHPDAVFDTGLWTEELIAERAAGYGLTPDQYQRRNLLHTEVTSAGVARVVAELCGETFSATTGAQIAIDGGSERVV